MQKVLTSQDFSSLETAIPCRAHMNSIKPPKLFRDLKIYKCKRVSNTKNQFSVTFAISINLEITVALSCGDSLLIISEQIHLQKSSKEQMDHFVGRYQAIRLSHSRYAKMFGALCSFPSFCQLCFISSFG